MSSPVSSSPDASSRGPVGSGAPASDNEAIKHLRHDLRTPLNQMIGYSEMLVENVAENGPPELLDDLQRLCGSAGELLTLLNDSLAQWKVEAGKVDLIGLRRSLLGPLNAFVGYRDLCQESARVKGRTEVVADLEKIDQATVNLRRLLDSESFANRYVATPPPPENLTVAPFASSVSPAASSHPPVAAAWGRILVVDDEPLNREMLLRRLARMGFTTAGAENGQKALELMERESFDLVLLDIMMPVMDGFVTLDRLKADPKLKHIPVVMLTALDEVASTVRCIEAGAEDYVPKPFNPVILRARMGASLDKKRLRDQERAFLAELQSERAKSERLLLNVLPKAIGDRLKSGAQTIVDAVPEATVMFADIVGFTRIAAGLPAARTVSLLNEIFSEFDHLSDEVGIEKIKTIGDAYMVVGGVPVPSTDHAVRCARMAFAMMDAIHRFNLRHKFDWKIRIGLHTGPLVAGIIGSTKFAYDLWGDTVNIASRLESHGEPNVPQVSEQTAALLRGEFELEPRGHIELKNRGEMKVFRLLRPKPQRT
ncbi:MAG: two-component hybrid sensor and regulator [Verrucomicrobia bacterium]|nr:two-component hybrid sensor and regulator [Verrucomicrobiota bacterium]